MDAAQEGKELRPLLLGLGLYVLSVAAEEGDYPRSPIRFYIQTLTLCEHSRRNAFFYHVTP